MYWLPRTPINRSRHLAYDLLDILEITVKVRRCHDWCDGSPHTELYDTVRNVFFLFHLWCVYEVPHNSVYVATGEVPMQHYFTEGPSV
jgi:hypothetical protein